MVEIAHSRVRRGPKVRSEPRLGAQGSFGGQKKTLKPVFPT